MAKDIQFDDKARLLLKAGIDKLAQAVRMTLGPRGRAAVIEKQYGAPQVTFDGVTVAKEIEFEDKFMNLGAGFIKQVAEKTNDNVGDGTTTSVVLAHAMIEAGEKIVKDSNCNVIQLSEELKKQSKRVIELLEEQKEEINDVKKLNEVATLSAKDKEIGALIAEVMEKLGKDGVVSIEDSNTISNSYEIVEGLKIDRGYVSQYMVTNQEKMTAELEKPYVLVTDKKLSSMQELLPLLEKILQSGKKDLLIIADDVDGEVLAALIVNKLRGILNVVAVKAPGFGDRKKEMLQDIAIVTGSAFITEDIGRKIDSADLIDLGGAHRIVATKDSLTIIGGSGEKDLIESRVSELKSQLKATESSYDKEKLEERIGKLSGGVAVIRVGSPVESAQKELKQRVEDAVAATRAAVEEGIIPGGGTALYNVYLTLSQEKQEGLSDVESNAKTILMDAILTPMSSIITNSGQSAGFVVTDVLSQRALGNENWIGFNAATNSVCNLKDAGIVDPLKVTKTAFVNAVSVASTYLTMGAAIVSIPEEKDNSAKVGPSMY